MITVEEYAVDVLEGIKNRTTGAIATELPERAQLFVANLVGMFAGKHTEVGMNPSVYAAAVSAALGQAGIQADAGLLGLMMQPVILNAAEFAAMRHKAEAADVGVRREYYRRYLSALLMEHTHIDKLVEIRDALRSLDGAALPEIGNGDE